MAGPSRFLVVEGPIARVLASHRTTDVHITEQTTAHHPDAHGSINDTHVFVNTAREFAMLLEVKGHTLKLVDVDYIAVAEGDEVRAVCRRSYSGPLIVMDWHNRTRAIRFRTIPQPLDGVMTDIVGTALLVIAGVVIAVWFGRETDSDKAMAIAAFLVFSALVLSLLILRKATELARVHEALDALTRP
ncbi:hypothetical protein [Sphingomonas bacterium]|uniref:hypothetical protein n=1 Tax=Sphingomonas bacterium TaxID=1895847 RepID=UPI00157565C4|nr:hypothetical protein [Sphingomonas bacterium]